MSVLIGEGQWRRIEADECGDQDILIERLRAGVGILVYDPQSRVTFGGHFPAPCIGNSDGLVALMNQAVEDFSESLVVRIYASGCAEQDHESWDETGAVSHRFVEAILNKHHRANQRRDLRWPRDNVLYAQMSLYPDSGEYGCSFHW